MAFCSFSKDFKDGGYTFVENKFITKYLPEANDFAVKVYLYGLYLCQKNPEDFTADSFAEVLGVNTERIVAAFEYWQDYDLVEIVSKSPLSVQYLPIASVSGKPKKIRYEKYTDFNKELQKKMQKVRKFITYNDAVKYMNFLEENDMQPMALLLVVEYCIMKRGEEVSASYIFNKAKKFLASGHSTYEQVERALGNYNEHEKELSAVFLALSITRKIDEDDYVLYAKWLETGFEKATIIAAAKHLKKGNLNTLSAVLETLAEKEKFKAKDAAAYLIKRDEMSNLTFRIARKLGVKIASSGAYIDEYVEKWTGQGFNEAALLDVALYCLKTDRGDFGAMDDLLSKLLTSGIVEEVNVKNYLKEKNGALKLLSKFRAHIGGMKNTEANLELACTWKSWGFTEEMLLEAAKRSASSASPASYMNRILSDWKEAGYRSVSDLQKEVKTGVKQAPSYQSAAVAAADAKTDREKFYAERRTKAQSVADAFLAKANQNARFKELSKALSKMELSLAKAEIYDPSTLPKLINEQKSMQTERKTILQGMGIEEWQLTPQYACKKCEDTGFLKSGAACGCYEK
ncbi:MAG: DnaD domain protein [Clostridia bacterium]|nr:DnaD domain protein [Clostridia bacterium]